MISHDLVSAGELFVMRGFSMIGAFAIGTMLASVPAFAEPTPGSASIAPNQDDVIAAANAKKCKNSTVQHPIKGCPASK